MAILPFNKKPALLSPEEQQALDDNLMNKFIENVLGLPSKKEELTTENITKTMRERGVSMISFTRNDVYKLSNEMLRLRSEQPSQELLHLFGKKIFTKLEELGFETLLTSDNEYTLASKYFKPTLPIFLLNEHSEYYPSHDEYTTAFTCIAVSDNKGKKKVFQLTSKAHIAKYDHKAEEFDYLLLSDSPDYIISLMSTNASKMGLDMDNTEMYLVPFNLPKVLKPSSDNLFKVNSGYGAKFNLFCLKDYEENFLENLDNYYSLSNTMSSDKKEELEFDGTPIKATKWLSPVVYNANDALIKYYHVDITFPNDMTQAEYAQLDKIHNDVMKEYFEYVNLQTSNFKEINHNECNTFMLKTMDGDTATLRTVFVVSDVKADKLVLSNLERLELFNIAVKSWSDYLAETSNNELPVHNKFIGFAKTLKELIGYTCFIFTSDKVRLEKATGLEPYTLRNKLKDKAEDFGLENQIAIELTKLFDDIITGKLELGGYRARLNKNVPELFQTQLISLRDKPVHNYGLVNAQHLVIRSNELLENRKEFHQLVHDKNYNNLAFHKSRLDDILSSKEYYVSNGYGILAVSKDIIANVTGDTGPIRSAKAILIPVLGKDEKLEGLMDIINDTKYGLTLHSATQVATGGIGDTTKTISLTDVTDGTLFLADIFSYSSVDGVFYKQSVDNGQQLGMVNIGGLGRGRD